RTLSRHRRVRPAAADGGCRSRPAAGAPPSRLLGGDRDHVGGALSARRLLAPAAPQPHLPRTVSCRRVAAADREALRMKRQLVIFARELRRGRVKRRLAAGIGEAATLAFYRRCLARLLRRVGRDTRWQTVLAVTPDGAARRARAWPLRLRRLRQGPGDLGQRMGRALRRGPPGAVCIVGADIPDVAATHVWRAFRALARADVVLGPAADGGYWLVGARGRARHADLFADVRWSSAHALAD